MKVILLKDVDKLGKKYEVKEVADGFALNFLIPKGLAKPATEKMLRYIEDKKAAEIKKAEEALAKVQQLASSVDGQEVVIPVKVGEEEQLFQSIGAQRIAEELKKLGFAIKKTQIELDKPIKELGEFPVKIHFEHNLEAEIRVVITEEKT